MKDNSTGKTVGFYERGQAIFDRIPKMPEKKKEMNAIPKQTRDDIDIVARHYGLLEANVKLMLDDARHAPVETSQTYAAIVRSILKEKK